MLVAPDAQALNAMAPKTLTITNRALAVILSGPYKPHHRFTHSLPLVNATKDAVRKALNEGIYRTLDLKVGEVEERRQA